MQNLSFLESFDHKVSTPVDHPIKTYDDGFAAGWSAAMAEFDSHQSRLKEEITTTLVDSSFGYHEAQAHFQAGMEAYLESIVELLIPATTMQAFHDKVLSALKENLDDVGKTPISLSVPSDQVNIFSEIVEPLNLTHLKILKNDEIDAHAAFIFGSGFEYFIDMNTAISVITAHSATLFEQQKGVS